MTYTTIDVFWISEICFKSIETNLGYQEDVMCCVGTCLHQGEKMRYCYCMLLYPSGFLKRGNSDVGKRNTNERMIDSLKTSSLCRLVADIGEGQFQICKDLIMMMYQEEIKA